MTFRPQLWVLFALAPVSGACGQASSSAEQSLEAALASAAPTRDGEAAPSFGARAAPYAGATAHRAEITLELRLDVPRGSRTMTLSRTIDRPGDGRFRVVDRRVLEGGEPARYEEGRDGVFDGSRFAMARRYGPWIERDTLDGLHDRFLRASYELAPAVTAAFGDYLMMERQTPGVGTLRGIPTELWRVGLNPRVRPADLDAAALGKLRDHEERWPVWVAATHQPTKVSGRLVRRAGAEEILEGELDIAGQAVVDGVAAPFSITLRVRVVDLPKDADFAVPDDAMPPTRPRPWRMIEQVLGDDLAEIYSR